MDRPCSRRHLLLQEVRNKKARDCTYFGRAKGLLGLIGVEGRSEIKKLVAAGGLRTRVVVWSHSARPFLVETLQFEGRHPVAAGGLRAVELSLSTVWSPVLVEYFDAVRYNNEGSVTKL